MMKKRKSREKGSRKGISTIVGIAVFFMIFAMSISAIWLWEQNVTSYLDAATQELAFEAQKTAEHIEVRVISERQLLLGNPTSQPIYIRAILSNNTIVWGSANLWFPMGLIPPFSSKLFNLTSSAAGEYNVVTSRGNIFIGGTEEKLSESGVWHVRFLASNTFPSNETAWQTSTQLGETYWYNTNINWKWNSTYPIMGKVFVQNWTVLGFSAKATFIKMVDEPINATINYYIDNASNVIFIIDNSTQKPISGVTWYNSSHYVWFTMGGGIYSYHTVEVLFVGTANLQELRLNVVNATFSPLRF